MNPHEEAARRWLAEDPDPETRAELQALLDAGDQAGIADRFDEPLTFGTAGIRGPLGAGPARMNRAMVRRITRGLATRLQAAEPGPDQVVIVGRDARHGSQDFMEDAVAVLAGAGLRVVALAGTVPTPLLAWACRTRQAIAGVMVTASHNPPQDNGYKVYAEGGSQILPPLDEEIAEAIAQVGSIADLPLAAPDDPLVEWLDGDDLEALVEGYVQQVVGAVCGTPDPARGSLRIVHTSLHGVAGPLATRVLRRAGVEQLHQVAEQADPDPEFPTVAFPNPEEPGAMDAALALAREVAADLVLANDPDGDRIAVAIPDAGADGGWQMLTGDQVGCLLAEDLLARGHMLAPGTTAGVATTVVSSSLLSRIAAHHGAAYAETLTGFKWLSARAADMADEGRTMVLAYEQALGVSVGDLVRDKDGISGALAVVDLAARRARDGQTLRDALDELDARHGVHVTGGSSLPLTDDAQVDLALGRLRAAPPTVLGTSPVTELWDHDAGVMTAADGALETIDLPAQQLIRIVAEDGSRVMVRPSGTEPKLKLYAEAIVHEDDLAAARDEASRRVQDLLTGLAQLITG